MRGFNQHTAALSDADRSKALRATETARRLRCEVVTEHERQTHRPIQPGRCDYCTRPCGKGRRFCSGGYCAAAHRDLAKHRGAQLYDLLYRWRKLRHTKGATAGVLSELARRVDCFIAEDRALAERMSHQTGGENEG